MLLVICIIIILLVLFWSSGCGDGDVETYRNHHTGVYLNNWEKYGNTRYQFYDDRTFGMDLDVDPCMKINNNRDYRKLINSLVNCKGKWCSHSKNKKWKCSKARNRKNKCYHVEHIIDKRSPEFDCLDCENIAANMVMSYGKWDNQLGTKLSYDMAAKEKERVYGKDRINKAKHYINYCHNRLRHTI